MKTFRHRHQPMMNPDLVYVRLDIFRVATSRIPLAFIRMGLDRIFLKRTPKLLFWKLLGTGSGRTFTVRDADAHQWAVLTTWPDSANSDEFGQSQVIASWRAMSSTHCTVIMRPLSTKGLWAGHNPFGNPLAQKPRQQPIAVITRARIKPRWWPTFWSSVPKVSADLHATTGLIASIGIGEAPLGLQGTFSIWESNDDITQFSTGRLAHREVIERTHKTGWYSEELFARFIITSMTGSLQGREWNNTWELP